MTSEQRERPVRKRAADPVQDHEGPSVVDEALRIGRDVARIVAPHARAALGFAATMIVWLGRTLLRAIHTHRSSLFRASHRLAWWSALLIFFVVARQWLGGFASDELLRQAPTLFFGGLALCGFVLVSAPELRMRAAALALGFGHGALGLLCMHV